MKTFQIDWTKTEEVDGVTQQVQTHKFDFTAVNTPNELEVLKVDENGDPITWTEGTEYKKATFILEEYYTADDDYDSDDYGYLEGYEEEADPDIVPRSRYSVVQTTDKDGTAHFEKLPKGQYRLTETDSTPGTLATAFSTRA